MPDGPLGLVGVAGTVVADVVPPGKGYIQWGGIFLGQKYFGADSGMIHDCLELFLAEPARFEQDDRYTPLGRRPVPSDLRCSCRSPDNGCFASNQQNEPG